MKNIKVAVVFIAGISLQAHANNSVDITSSTPEGVHTKFESAHQVRDRMASSGFTLHRCGIQSIKKGHMLIKIWKPHTARLLVCTQNLVRKLRMNPKLLIGT